MVNFLFYLVFFAFLPLVISLGGPILGPGRWLVLNIEPCSDPDQYEMMFDMSRRKINRTHDCFTFNMDLQREFNNTIGVKIDVYQEVDGGFKFYQTISDDCACKFLMKHAEENTKRFLTMAKIDPPDCPIKPGIIKLENYVMDYTELPINGVYGTYEAITHLTYNDIRIGCVKVTLNFDVRKDADEEDYDDDDDD